MKKCLTLMGLMSIPALYSIPSIVVPKAAAVLFFLLGPSGSPVVALLIFGAVGAAAGALLFADINFRSFLIAIL